MTTRRERLVVLVLGAVGAALALLTAGRTWLTVTVRDPLVGDGRIHPDGRSVAALVPAAALVGLAAVVAAVTMRRVGRQVAGLLLIVAGAAVGAAAVSVLAHPRSSAAEAVGAATGRTGEVSAVASASPSLWPWVAVLAAVPLVLAGIVTVVRGRRWSGLSGRYEAPTLTGAEPAVATAGRADPTPSPAEADRADAAAADAAADAWDAVSRGEDPTR